VVFEELEPAWKESPFLLSKIRFKPPLIAQLAREAGLEPGVLDLLRRLGVTSEAQLRERLGISDDIHQLGQVAAPTVEENLDPPGESQHNPKPAEDSIEQHSGTISGGVPKIAESSEASPAQGSDSEADAGDAPAARLPGARNTDARPTSSAGSPPFISYVAARLDDEEQDPDGLSEQERLHLEEQALTLILSHEPRLERTPTNNPGFDLVEKSPYGDVVRWIEVKAMTSTLKDRPVALSRTQFEHAERLQNDYWLYVVERAGSPESARILRIQDPAGKAKSFTFDSGWSLAAEEKAP
jgi:hypothetical protein